MIVSVNALASSTLTGRTYTRLEGLQLALLNHSNLGGELPTNQHEFEDLMKNKDNVLLSVYSETDSWGQLLVYRYPSVSSIRAFDLYSIGADGLDNKGEHDDVVSWQYRGYYESNHKFSTLLSFYLILIDGPILLIGLVAFYLLRRYKKSSN